MESGASPRFTCSPYIPRGAGKRSVGRSAYRVQSSLGDVYSGPAALDGEIDGNVGDERREIYVN